MKISNTYKLTTLLLQLFIVIGCKNNAVRSISENSFFPLAVGNTWKYSYTAYDSLGTKKSDTLMTEILVQSRLKNDTFAYELDSPLNPPKTGAYNEAYYYQNSIDGVHFLKSSDPTGYWISDHLLYKFPVSKNDIFINTYVYNDTTYVISSDDTVACTAGTFRCIVYKNIYRDYGNSEAIRMIGYSQTYVASGVGKIKYELFLMNNAQQPYKAAEYSLINYTLF